MKAFTGFPIVVLKVMNSSVYTRANSQLWIPSSKKRFFFETIDLDSGQPEPREECEQQVPVGKGEYEADEQRDKERNAG